MNIDSVVAIQFIADLQLDDDGFDNKSKPKMQKRV
jgi:hypothetical protein